MGKTVSYLLSADFGFTHPAGFVGLGLPPRAGGENRCSWALTGAAVGYILAAFICPGIELSASWTGEIPRCELD